MPTVELRRVCLCRALGLPSNPGFSISNADFAAVVAVLAVCSGQAARQCNLLALLATSENSRKFTTDTDRSDVAEAEISPRHTAAPPSTKGMLWR